MNEGGVPAILSGFRNPPSITFSDELYVDVGGLTHKEDGRGFWHKFPPNVSPSSSSDFRLTTCKGEVKRAAVEIVNNDISSSVTMPVDPEARCVMTRVDICFLRLETLGGDVRKIVKPILGNTVKPRSVDSRKKDAACPPVACAFQ